MIYWRNSNLNFKSPDKLISSLEQRPTNYNLIRTQDSLDESVLRHFLKLGNNNIIYHKNLELLWECCQIPDFEKKAYGQHINIIDKVNIFKNVLEFVSHEAHFFRRNCHLFKICSLFLTICVQLSQNCCLLGKIIK